VGVGVEVGSYADGRKGVKWLVLAIPTWHVGDLGCWGVVVRGGGLKSTGVLERGNLRRVGWG
jgi:hypothetical protein